MRNPIHIAWRHVRRFFRFWRADGEAQFEQPEPADVLLRRQVSSSALHRQFLFILSLSSCIASLGLMADSAVTVVGAMLIAPLMKPIIALAYGLVIAERRLQLRAGLSLAMGIAMTVLVAAAVERAFDLRGPTVQILSRTSPSLIDLGVAVAAGTAAAIAVTRRNVADTLPGVAIAVALVPPLCVVGIGLSTGAWAVSQGAALLFAVNLAAIILCASLVFVVEGYGSWRRAWPGMVIVLLSVTVLCIPLTGPLQQLRVDDLAQQTIEDHLHEQFPINRKIHPNDLRRVTTRLYRDHVYVFADIEAPAGHLTEKHCREIHRQLTEAIGMPVNLKIQLAVTEEIDVYSHRLPDGSHPLYGASDLVPRR